MKAHDYLYAGVSLFVCRRMIFYLQTQQTTAQQASGPDTGSIGRDTDKPHPNSRESLQASDRDNKIQC